MPFEGAYGASKHGRADPREAVDAIISAITDPGTPFRTLVGADAQLIAGLKRETSFEAYESTILATLGLDRPGAEAAEAGASSSAGAKTEA